MSPTRRSQRVMERSLHTEKSSNTNPPAQARAKTTLTVLPHFPNEIILTIVGHLAFDDLKSARLLSKLWSSCASTFLFVNLSVSPNKEDLEVFEAITRHPQLSKFVRHLWYDGSEFLLHLTKHWYLYQLYRQTENLNQASHNQLHSSDLEINSWIQDVACNEMSFEEILALYRSTKFVHDGYRKYHEHAIYQQKCLQDGTFVKRLVQGLKQLDHLRSVALECSWISNHSPLEPGKGSHLARNWNIFHCRPASWDWGPRTKWVLTHKAGHGAAHYRILVSALAQAQRRIRAFQIGPGPRCAVPPYVFNANLKTRKAKPLHFHDDNVIAFSGIEELGLQFATYGFKNTAKLFENIANLPALLRSMDHLKHLDLRLPGYHFGFLYSYYSYNQVFPKTVRWESLKLLKLFRISIAATDFILLLLDAMPELKHLEMGDINVSRGCWQGIFEALKQMHRLRVLILPIFENLYHHGDRELVQDYSRRPVLYRQFTAYVINGKRHPSLSPEQPDSAAREYTRDLDPVLRQRLLNLDLSRY